MWNTTNTSINIHTQEDRDRMDFCISQCSYSHCKSHVCSKWYTVNNSTTTEYDTPSLPFPQSASRVEQYRYHRITTSWENNNRIPVSTASSRRYVRSDIVGHTEYHQQCFNKNNNETHGFPRMRMKKWQCHHQNGNNARMSVRHRAYLNAEKAHRNEMAMAVLKCINMNSLPVIHGEKRECGIIYQQSM